MIRRGWRGWTVLGLALVVSLLASPVAGIGLHDEVAWVSFQNAMKVSDVLLKGEFLIVHDDDMAAIGAPCLSIYRVREGEIGDLVLSVRCTRVKRTETNRLKLVTQVLQPGIYDLREIQFPGSPDGHRLQLR